MQVRLLTDRVGNGFHQRIGDIIDVESAVAVRLIEVGQAESVSTEIIETAAIDHRSRERRKHGKG